MKCLILAGGLGTRMQGHTKDKPKALIPVHGIPFLAYQLSWMKNQGITEAVLSIGYLGEQIESFAGNGAKWGMKIRYVNEGKDLRGTGGAIRFAIDQGAVDKGETFFVQYGDSFLPVEYPPILEHFEASHQEALMTVYENEGKFDTSNVVFESGKLVVYDKMRKPEHVARMRHIDYGLSLLREDVVSKRIRAGVKVDLAEMLHELSAEKKLEGYEVHERFYEIGSVAGLKDMEVWVEAQKQKGDLKWLKN